MSNFYTDVIVKSALFNSPGRVATPSLLEYVTLGRVQEILVEAERRGERFMIYETYRSLARQAVLFARKVSKRREVGVHHYGLACDIVKEVGGDPSWKGSFKLLGELAKKHGLLWGGDWGDPSKKHTFVDAVHVQRCELAQQNALFKGMWYPDPSA